MSGPPQIPRRPTTSFKGGVRPESHISIDSSTVPPISEEVSISGTPLRKSGKPAPLPKPKQFSGQDSDDAGERPKLVPRQSKNSPPSLAPRQPKEQLPPLVERKPGRPLPPPIPQDSTNPPPVSRHSGIHVEDFAPTVVTDGSIAAYDETSEHRENILREDGYEQCEDQDIEPTGEYNTIDEPTNDSSTMYGSNNAIKRRPAPPIPTGDATSSETELVSPGLPPVPDASNRRPLPPLTASVTQPSGDDEDDEDSVYEEVTRTAQSVQPDDNLSEVADNTDGPGAVESIYEAIEDVVAASPPPVPAPYSPDKDGSSDIAVKDTAVASKPIQRKKMSFFGKSLKGPPKGKLQPSPPEYERILDELDVDAPKLFDVRASAESIQKFVDDLKFSARDTVEILQIEDCPAGKWIGRIAGIVGFAECSKLHVDADALKQMMLNQDVVKPVATPSTVSAEGIPHSIGQAGASSDSVPTIQRKPKPQGDAPPPPVSPFKASDDGSSKKVAYETMEDANLPGDPQGTYEVVAEVLDRPQTYEKMSPPHGLGKGQAALVMGDHVENAADSVPAPELVPRGASRSGAKMSAGQRALLTNSMIGGVSASDVVVGSELGTSDENYENLPSRGAPGDASNDYMNMSRSHPDSAEDGIYSNIDDTIGGVPQPATEPGTEDMYDALPHSK